MKIPWYLMAKGKGGGGYKTASGPIVSINDALAAPLRSLRIAIDPVQDLHGYDSPWPAGGGKNKFNIADVAINEFQTVSGNTITKAYSAYNFDLLNGTTGASSLATKKISLAAGAYTISGAVTSDSSVGVRVYTVDSDGVVAETHLVAINANTPYATFTLSESGYITLRYSAREACTVSNIQIEPGSFATPYAPYSNLCPISGHTGGNVWRTGKNLLDPDKRTQTSNNIRYYVADGFLLKSGQTYTLTVSGSPASALYFVRMSDNSNIALKYSDTKLTYTPTEDVLVKCNIYYSPAPSGGLDDIKCQLELSSTPTPYTPYTGTTIPVTWSEAGTVYGGVWDVLNGVLKKTWGMAILANRTWTMETTANGNVFSCNLLPDKAKSYNQMCSKYKAVNNYRNYLKNGEMGTYNATNGRNRVSICDNAYSTVSDFVNGLAGVDYIYELATPLTYTLTPQQLDTLAGQNVVWGDAGDVTVEYLASGGANADLMKLAVAFMGRK